jgi:hypothetical protein
MIPIVLKIILFPIWLIDRALHLVLPHREHPKYMLWLIDWNIVKYSLIRSLIFSIVWLWVR